MPAVGTGAAEIEGATEDSGALLKDQQVSVAFDICSLDDLQREKYSRNNE